MTADAPDPANTDPPVHRFGSQSTGNRRITIDTIGPPLAFVAGSRLSDVATAAIFALAAAAILGIVRAVRRQPLRYAFGGVAGVGIAAGAALWSGEPTAYFLPATLLNAAYAVAAVGSIAVRRPLAGWAAVILLQWPAARCWSPEVRPALTTVTWAWVGLFSVRAVVRYSLIVSGQLELLAVAHIALGIPAFAGVAAFSYWYLRRHPSFTPRLDTAGGTHQRHG